MATLKTQLPPFDGAALGSVITVRPDINSRLLHGFLFQVVGTGALTFAEYVEYLILNQDDKQKILLKPTIQAMADALNNANSDTLDATFFYLPLTRPGMNFSPWGTADISRLSIQAKIVGANPGGKTLTKIQGWMAHTPVSNPQPRGDVFLQSIITTPLPVAGWNTLANIEVKDISTVTKLVLADTAVTQVRITVGERQVYDMTLAAANEAGRRNPLVKIPVVPTCFPVILDDLGIPSDFIPLLENGVRRPLNVEFYYDTTVHAAAAFDILVEGVELGARAPVATSRA